MESGESRELRFEQGDAEKNGKRPSDAPSPCTCTVSKHRQLGNAFVVRPPGTTAKKKKKVFLLRRPPQGPGSGPLDPPGSPTALSQWSCRARTLTRGISNEASLFAHGPCLLLPSRGGGGSDAWQGWDESASAERTAAEPPQMSVSRMPCTGCKTSCIKRRFCRQGCQKKTHTERAVTISNFNAANAAMEAAHKST